MIERQRIMLKALALLARREYNQPLLKAALQKSFAASSYVDEVLVELIDTGALSDARYAEVYCRHLVNQFYGPHYVSRQMAAKGVVPQLIEEAMDSAEIDWMKNMRHLYYKKYGINHVLGMKDKQKAWQYFYRRGFSSDQIGSLFKSIS